MDYDVVLYGGYGLGNFGDDILMISFINSIREIAPQSTIAISAVRNDGTYLPNFAKGIDILDRNLPASVKCRVLIYGGGTQWYSFPNTTEAPNDDEFRPIDIIKNVIDSGKRMIGRKPAEPQMLIPNVQLAMGIGIGPFMAGKEKRTFRELRKCSYIGVRDPISLKWCNEHKLKQAHLRADICYAAEYWKPSGIYKSHLKRKPIIGIIPRDWIHTNEGAEYLIPLVKVGKELKGKGYDVRYLVFSKLREINTMNLLNNEQENYSVWDPKELSNIGEFTNEIAECDLVISARYHGIVAAATLGIPAIAIEVEPKLVLVSRVLSPGCDLWNQPFLPEKLMKQIKLALLENEIRSDAMATNAYYQRKSAAMLINDVAKFIQN